MGSIIATLIGHWLPIRADGRLTNADETLRSRKPIEALGCENRADEVVAERNREEEDPEAYRTVYSKEKLLKWQQAPISLKMPQDLPKYQVCLKEVRLNPLDEQRGGGYGDGGGNRGFNAPRTPDMFLPAYALRDQHTSRRSRSNSQCQRSCGTRTSQEENRKEQITSSLSMADIHLHTAVNAWKPDVCVKKIVTVVEDEKGDAEKARLALLVKKFRGILNRITPQKYELLVRKVTSLVIDTEDRLNTVFDMVYDRAVDEPVYSTQYAYLCKHLSRFTIKKLNAETGQEEEVKFKKLLLLRCQKEVESDVYQDIDLPAEQKAIDESEDAAVTEISMAEFEEEKRRSRKKSLGNIKLISELYRLHLLKILVILNLMHKLMSELSEISLECLCALLLTIGGQLEEECKSRGNEQEHFEPFFKLLTVIFNQKKTSPRVQFLIQDVLEMRSKGWKVLKIQEENNAKTIDQIHADF